MCYLDCRDTAMLSKRTLCQGLEDAYDDDRDFEFYVPEESQGDIHVPCNPYIFQDARKTHHYPMITSASGT
ncbi:hypothetical protein CKAH01_07468 [Colletotrichum kahawae]|uniref:Uncharacterized protein n=1 Tax=Colletotrichum kahawae TaxID=34407 RepID=A0AAD9Y3Z7_COLKA|nr:hypothetical protein CKAH01_07468 [Colletotrichum kahawae]